MKDLKEKMGELVTGRAVEICPTLNGVAIYRLVEVFGDPPQLRSYKAKVAREDELPLVTGILAQGAPILRRDAEGELHQMDWNFRPQDTVGG